MFVEPIKQATTVCQNNSTLDDMHVEFSAKYARFNHGLKPSTSRQLPELEPQPISEWQKLHEEFKAKLDAKKRKNIKKLA